MPTIIRRAPRTNTTGPQQGFGALIGQGLSQVGGQLKKRGEKVRVDREEGFAYEDSIRFHKELNEFRLSDLQRTIEEGTEENHPDNVDIEAQRLKAEMSSGRSKEYVDKLSTETRTSRIFANGRSIEGSTRAVFKRNGNSVRESLRESMSGVSIENFDPAVMESQKQSFIDHSKRLGVESLGGKTPNQMWDSMVQGRFEQLLTDRENTDIAKDIIGGDFAREIFRTEDGDIDNKRITRIENAINTNRLRAGIQDDILEKEFFRSAYIGVDQLIDRGDSLGDVTRAIDDLGTTISAEVKLELIDRAKRRVRSRDVAFNGAPTDEEIKARNLELKDNARVYKGNIANSKRVFGEISRSDLDGEEKIKAYYQEYRNLMNILAISDIDNKTRTDSLLVYEIISMQDKMMAEMKVSTVWDGDKPWKDHPIKGPMDSRTADQRRLLPVMESFYDRVRSGEAGVPAQNINQVIAIMRDQAMAFRATNIGAGFTQDYIPDGNSGIVGDNAQAMAESIYQGAISSVFNQTTVDTMNTSQQERQDQVSAPTISQLVGQYGSEAVAQGLVAKGRAKNIEEARAMTDDFIGPKEVEKEDLIGDRLFFEEAEIRPLGSLNAGDVDDTIIPILNRFGLQKAKALFDSAIKFIDESPENPALPFSGANIRGALDLKGIKAQELRREELSDPESFEVISERARGVEHRQELDKIRGGGSGLLSEEDKEQSTGLPPKLIAVQEALKGTFPERDIDGALDVLVEEEGYRTEVYTDSEGHLTAGVGHKLTKSEMAKFSRGDTVPDPQIQLWLVEDTEKALGSARQVVKGFETLPREVKDVLVSMVFQMGKTGVMKFKNMRKHLDKRPFTQEAANKAADEMLNSKWAKQTPGRARRAAEIVRNSV